MLRSVNATAKLPAMVETTSYAGGMATEMKYTFLLVTGVSFSCCARGKKSQLPLASDYMSMYAIWNRFIPGIQLTLILNGNKLLDG